MLPNAQLQQLFLTPLEVASHLPPAETPQTVRNKLVQQINIEAKRKEAAARAERYQALLAAGFQFHRLSTEEHRILVEDLQQAMDIGEKPNAADVVRTYARIWQKPEGWVEKILPQSHPKKMRRLLPNLLNRPAMLDLKEGKMLDQTRKSQLTKATLMGFVSTVHSGSTLVRAVRALQQHAAATDRKLAEVTAKLQQHEARLALVETWQQRAETLRELGKSYGEIADVVGRPRSTVSDYFQRKKKQ